MRLLGFLQYFVLSLLLGGYTSLLGQEAEQKKELFDVVLKQMDDSPFALSALQQTPLNLIFFLSPECPLCENYSLTIRTLREQTSTDSVAFYGVFSGTYFSPKTIQTYLDRYKPEVIPLLDADFQTKSILEANVTPEVFLIDAAGNILYSGSIDNWIPALGKKRTVITRHYLKAALQASLNGREVLVPHTRAIGCFIE